MDAMAYEILLRRVYNCGRDYGKGADADIYRRMDHAFRNLETKSLYKTQEEREYEYRKAFVKVRGHVRDAILSGVKKIQYSAPKEEVERLQKMADILDFDFYDSEKLDNIIDGADNIFRLQGLEMR